MTFMMFLLKLTLPIYLYYFLRIFIASKLELIGIFQTFLYSILFALPVMLYEILGSPLQLTEARGLERIQGGYADVVNYVIYIII